MNRLRRLSRRLNDSLIGDAVGAVCLMATCYLLIVAVGVLQ